MVFYKAVKNKYFTKNRKESRKKLQRPTIYYLLSFLNFGLTERRKKQALKRI